MMILGMFPFMLETLPYDTFQRKMGWRHASNSRVGQRPATQFLGPDDETVSLSGQLLPAIQSFMQRELDRLQQTAPPVPRSVDFGLLDALLARTVRRVNGLPSADSACA